MSTCSPEHRWYLRVVSRSRLVRGIYLFVGLVSLGVGLIGIALPLIPTTGPILLAGFCFARSSDRFDSWLVNHRLFGPILTDWRGGYGFTVRAKSVAVTAITITFGISIAFFVTNTAVRAALVALAVGLVVYIITRPTKASSPAGLAS